MAPYGIGSIMTRDRSKKGEQISEKIYSQKDDANTLESTATRIYKKNR